MKNETQATELYNQIVVSDIMESETTKMVLLSTKTNYVVPGITEDTTSECTLGIVTTSQFGEQVYADQTLSRILMNATTNAVLLEHISQTLTKDFVGICSNNQQAKRIYDSIQGKLDEVTKDIIDLIVKIG